MSLIKLLHQRKRNQIRHQIVGVRRILTENILAAEKKGNDDVCVNSIVDKNRINKYCIISYRNEPETELECKKINNFCYLCCENEFGDFHKDEREICFKKCEKEHDTVYNNKNSKYSNSTAIEISTDPNKYRRFIS